MKDEEEMGRGDRRGFAFETDDEENRGSTAADGYTTSSSSASLSTSPDFDENAEIPYSTTWPQSYRQSIDVFSALPSPTVGFLRGSSFLGGSFFKPSTYGDVVEGDDHAALSEPLVAGTTQPQVPATYAGDSLTPTRHSSLSKVSFSSFRDLPPSPQCSSAQAVANGLNVLCGVGLLSTPYAVKEGGWLGMLALFALGFISCYTGILLKKCLDSSPGLRSYPDIGQAAFGLPGRLCISVILYLELYACCVEYITLISDSLSYLFPETHMNVSGFDLNCHEIFALTTVFLVLPTVWLRDLKLLSYLSASGVVASLVVVVCLLWVGFVDGVGFHPSGTSIDFVNFPVALGLYGFCYAGHSVFPNIYSSMKKQSQFPLVLILSFVISTVLYSGVAVAGFTMFGSSIKSQFTLSMPQQFGASKLAVWTTVVNPLSKYALTMTPVALSLEELFPSTQQSYCIAVLMRTALVLSTLFVALSVPFFGYVMALLGSFFTMLVALILPCACYLRIYRSCVCRIQVLVLVSIILVGVACSVVGSYASIKQIIEKMV